MRHKLEAMTAGLGITGVHMIKLNMIKTIN